MSLLSRQSLQNKQCFHNLYAYLSAARNIDQVAALGPQDTSKGWNELSLQELGFPNNNPSPTQSQAPDSLSAIQ
jgi:hypothetical protein